MSDNTYPLVSAILLAGKHGLPDVLCAIECFRQQTYPNIELIIVNNANSHFQASGLSLPHVENIFLVDTPMRLTAGMARNYGIRASNGHMLAQFDPDFYHAPNRIAAQAACMAEHTARACMLSETLSYSYLSGRATRHYNNKSVILNTMMYVRPQDADYDDVEKYEELSLLNKLSKSDWKPVTLQQPELCCKLYGCANEREPHNDGLSDEHFSTVVEIIRGRSELSCQISL